MKYDSWCDFLSCWVFSLYLLFKICCFCFLKLEDSNEEEDSDEDSDEKTEGKDKKKPGVYVPPKLAAVHYGECHRHANQVFLF